MRLARGVAGVVTGAGSGIGRALALALAREGCGLALADKDPASVANTAADAKKAGAGTVSTHAVDVADLAEMTRFRDEVKHAHSYVQLLINNAGVALAGNLEEMSVDDMRWLFDINFWGVVHGTRLFLPLLRENREAQIVNISSVLGIIGVPGQSAYCASKFAVRGFSEAVRQELAGSGVRVSTVHPGGVRTNIARNARLPAKSDPMRRERTVKSFERMARITPDQAAARILRGIKRGEERIIVGQDAQIMTALQRLMPVNYWRVIRRLVPGEVRKTGRG